MTTEPIIIDVTDEELKERIERWYERFPVLRGWQPARGWPTCNHHSGCREEAVRLELGPAAGNAWAQIAAAKWLLGEDING